MGAESRLFCGSEPASCWIAVGEAWSGEQAKTIMVALKDYYTSLTGARPRTHFDHSPDLVRLTPLPFLNMVETPKISCPQGKVVKSGCRLPDLC